MTSSIFDIFKVGPGPSSSHTVAPMKIAFEFLNSHLRKYQSLENINTLNVYLYGSLALTGKGHRTHTAIMTGLSGHDPSSIIADEMKKVIETINQTQKIILLKKHSIEFNPDKNIIFNFKKRLSYHSNGMELETIDSDGNILLKETYYSTGGGQFIEESQIGDPLETRNEILKKAKLPYPYISANQLLADGKKNNISFAQMFLENELVFREKETIHQELLKIWTIMQECVQTGMHTKGPLPGPLHVDRRAHSLWNTINQQTSSVPDGNESPDFSLAMDWVSLWAIAINEENACGGRVVTAPTNGGSGTLPAVLHYYWYFSKNPSVEGIIKFLLVSGGIGILYQLGASISAAEVGCQGEIGVACSMAAGGLAAALGASNEIIENAAEIAMEHNLGLTCDPVGGLVQIPCIERNVMGAIKAISACRLAMKGNGEHKISLDKVIKTMLQTGKDMQDTYKETSLGGLAVNVPDC